MKVKINVNEMSKKMAMLGWVMAHPEYSIIIEFNGQYPSDSSLRFIEEKCHNDKISLRYCGTISIEDLDKVPPMKFKKKGNDTIYKDLYNGCNKEEDIESLKYFKLDTVVLSCCDDEDYY